MILNFGNLTLINRTEFDINLGILEVPGNFSNISLTNMTANHTNKIIALYDDYLTVSIDYLGFHLDLDYEYLSKPAIFVDIGSIDVNLEGFKFFLSLTTNWENYDLSFVIKDFGLGLDALDIEIDGLSDLSIIVNNLLHKVLWLLGVKVTELTTSNLHSKFVPLVNKFVDNMPDTVGVNSPGLHLDVAFASNIICKENSYL